MGQSASKERRAVPAVLPWVRLRGACCVWRSTVCACEIRLTCIVGDPQLSDLRSSRAMAGALTAKALDATRDENSTSFRQAAQAIGYESTSSQVRQSVVPYCCLA